MKPRAAAVRALLAVVLLTVACAVRAAPERLAWVVGQEAYPNARLRTVTRDARNMDTALSNADWKVRKAPIDAPPDVLTADLGAFLEQVRKSPGAEVFVYLSGHGVEIDGGARLQVIPPVPNGRNSQATLAVADILAALEAAGALRAVVVFDACRDTRAAGAYSPLLPDGVVRATPPRRGTMEHLVLYATASGTLAEDGVASGGRFTSELIAALGQSGMSVQDAFERARRQVWVATQGRQRPEMAVSSGAVLFRSAAGQQPKAGAPESAAEANQLAEVRKLLGAGPPVVHSMVSDDDRETERDIDVAMHLLFPLKQESLDKLERLVAQGMPWAALALAMNLKGGFVGPAEPARARQLEQQLQRAGLEARLDGLYRQGSHAATMALALLAGNRNGQSAGQERELLGAAARAGYEPALQAYLLTSAAEVDLQDDLAREAEQVFRDRAATGSLQAQWTLALLAFTRINADLDKGRVIDQAAARAGMVARATPLVDQGVPFASVLLLGAYLDPTWGAPDFAAADPLCERARQARNAFTITLCAFSWSGYKLPREDAARALAWMREAADLGEPRAANQAGVWLYEGYGGERDAAAAFRYLDSCAQRGLEQCMTNAAYALRAGAGTKRDVHRARALYETAARNGDNTAGNLLARMLIEEHELARDDAGVRRWLQHGIDRNDPEAWATLAELRRDGRAGMAESPREARDLLEKAAQMGSLRAQARWCEMQVTGEGGERDIAEGMACLERMTEQGVVTAAMVLARFLMNGEPIPRDERRAYALYEALVQRGEPAALAQLGQFHEFGLGGMAVDEVQAWRMYTQAADAGSIDGLAYLGALMTSSRASPVDRRAGLVHLERAAATGHAVAQRLLAHEKAVSATRR